MDWSKHFRSNCPRYYVLCFSFLNKYFILSWFCHSGLNLLFWTDFFILDWSVILDWIVHVIMCYVSHSGMILSLWASFVHSGMISSFWTELQTMGWRPILVFWVQLIIQGYLRHSTTLTFWAEFFILGRFCHCVLNFSFCTKFFIWVEFIISGWICQSGQICYYGLVPF